MSEFWDEFVTEENAAGKPDAEESNPFDPFESGPGKPSLKRGYLRNQRDHILCLIEPCWHELQWALECAETPEQIHSAFQIDAFKTSPGPLAPLLRPAAEPATLKDLEGTRKQRGNANELAAGLWNRYQEQLRVHEETSRVASQLSEEFAQHLQRELEKRTANIPKLAEEAATLKEEIRERELESKTRMELKGEPLWELADLRKRRDTLMALLADERKACPSIKSRIQAITPDARKLANEEQFRQKSILNVVESDWKKADREQRRIDERFSRQESFVFRKEILNLINAKEYTLIPLHLANAIAGLPYITARRSAQRCTEIFCAIAKPQTYQLFEFVTDVWEQYRERESRKSLVDAFENAIRALPKFEIKDHHRKKNWFRAYLAANWYYVKGALAEEELGHLDARAVPSRIVKRFLQQMHSPDSPVTAILAKREQIVD